MLETIIRGAGTGLDGGEGLDADGPESVELGPVSRQSSLSQPSYRCAARRTSWGLRGRWMTLSEITCGKLRAGRGLRRASMDQRRWIPYGTLNGTAAPAAEAFFLENCVQIFFPCRRARRRRSGRTGLVVVGKPTKDTVSKSGAVKAGENQGRRRRCWFVAGLSRGGGSKCEARWGGRRTGRALRFRHAAHHVG